MTRNGRSRWPQLQGGSKEKASQFDMRLIICQENLNF